jgi:hypothetical protein
MSSYPIPIKDVNIFIPQYWQKNNTVTNNIIVRPSGVDSDIQFNKNNRFGSDSSKFFYDDANDILNVPKMNLTNLSLSTQSNVIYFNTVTKALSYGTLSNITASGATGYIQYRSSNGNLDSSANLFWDISNNRLGINKSNPQSTLDIQGRILVQDSTLNISTDGTVNQLRLQATGDDALAIKMIQENSNVCILSNQGINILDSTEDNTLMSITTDASYIPKIYLTGGGVASNSILVKQSDNEIKGFDGFTYDELNELLSVSGQMVLTGSVMASSFSVNSRLNVINDFNIISIDAVVTREYIDYLRSSYSSSFSTENLSLTNDTNTPNNCILYKNSSDQIVGSSALTFQNSVMYVPSLNSNGTIVCSGITITGSSTGSTSVGNGLPIGGSTNQALIKKSLTNYDSEWRTIYQPPAGGTTNQVLSKNSNTDYDYSWKTVSSSGGTATIQWASFFQGSEFSANGGGAENVMSWNGLSQNGITGLTLNTTNGQISITQPGLYTFSWSIAQAGSSATGSRQTWMRINNDTQRWGANSSTSGGSTIFFLGCSVTLYFSTSATVIIYIAHNSSNVQVYGTHSSSPTNSTSVSKLQISRIA